MIWLAAAFATPSEVFVVEAATNEYAASVAIRRIFPETPISVETRMVSSTARGPLRFPVGSTALETVGGLVDALNTQSGSTGERFRMEGDDTRIWLRLSELRDDHGTWRPWESPLDVALRVRRGQLGPGEAGEAVWGVTGRHAGPTPPGRVERKDTLKAFLDRNLCGRCAWVHLANPAKKGRIEDAGDPMYRRMHDELLQHAVAHSEAVFLQRQRDWAGN